VFHASKPASQSKVGSSGQPAPPCLQHQSFFSSDQPVCQSAMPAKQSKNNAEVLVEVEVSVSVEEVMVVLVMVVDVAVVDVAVEDVVVMVVLVCEVLVAV